MMTQRVLTDDAGGTEAEIVLLRYFRLLKLLLKLMTLVWSQSQFRGG